MGTVPHFNRVIATLPPLDSSPTLAVSLVPNGNTSTYSKWASAHDLPIEGSGLSARNPRQ